MHLPNNIECKYLLTTLKNGSTANLVGRLKQNFSLPFYPKAVFSDLVHHNNLMQLWLVKNYFNQLALFSTKLVVEPKKINMRKYLAIYLICLGITFLTTNCSSHQGFNNNTQQSLRNDGQIDLNHLTKDTIVLESILISININSHEKITFPFGSIAPTLMLHNNERFSGFAVCNSFFGMYSIKGNSIRFENLTRSMKNCINDKYIEDIITRTLGEINNYSIEGKNLLLKNDADVLMIYRIYFK